MARGQIRFHLPERLLAPGDMPPFYRKLMGKLRSAGADVCAVPRDFDALASASGAHFDFVHNGTIARPQALNLGAAYLADYYYCDPKGLYFESLINELPFDPSQLNPAVSADFFDQLQRDFVAPRRSRYAQPTNSQEFGAGHIAIFLQDWSRPLERARYVAARDMVAAVVADTGGRRVVVKPHPRNIGVETLQILRDLRGRDDVEISEANLHDILKGAALTVSISSSAALEGMLQRVPAVLFGRSDMHPCAQTVRHLGDWPAARDAALARDWPFEAFLHWFLRRHAIYAKGAFFPKILDRMTQVGADLAALGLKSADANGPRT